MLKKLTAVLTAALICTGLAALPVQAEEPEKLRVMPLGDSITDGFTGDPVGGYRLTLWKLLEAGGYAEGVDMVGPNWGGDGIDPNHAGYSGYAIADIPNMRMGIYNFSEWLMQEYPPDVVLLQIGTNDILSSYELDGMGARLELLVDVILEALPEDGMLFLATIPDMDADVTNYTSAYTAEEMDAAVAAYNTQVRALAAKKQAAGAPVTLADIHGVLTKADLLDGVHPSAVGYEKMGQFWYGQLTSFIDGTQPPEPPTEGTSEDTAATAATEAEPPAGDVDQNGRTELLDVVLLTRYLLGTATLAPEQWNAADVMRDEAVDVFDLGLLKRMVME